MYVSVVCEYFNLLLITLFGFLLVDLFEFGVCVAIRVGFDDCFGLSAGKLRLSLGVVILIILCLSVCWFCVTVGQ